MDLQTQLKKFIDHNRNKCDFIAIRWIGETSTQYQYRNQKPLPPSKIRNVGAMVEVHLQGHIGYGATSSAGEIGLNHAFESALKLAKSHYKYALTRFSNSELIRPVYKGKYQSALVRDFQKLDQLSLASMSSFLKKCNEYLQGHDPMIINAHSQIYDQQITQLYFTSLGTEIEQNFQKLGINLSATAQKGNEVQFRSYHGGLADCSQKPINSLNEQFYFNACEKTQHEALELLDAQECPTETMDLILMPDQMMLQIHESVGHPLEMDRILGDEKNYAGSSFVNLEDIGQLQYGSPLMNATFDPTPEAELASYAFDENGQPSQKEYLIKDGILVRALGGLESQYRTGREGVANARASSWNRAPIDRMANLNLEPGSSSFEEIIASVRRGVIMHANKSWSIDDYRNKFQFGCEYGQLVENGRITKTVKNPNYRGQTVSFWNTLKKVGDKKTLETFGSFYCGKGEPSQVISVGHRSPICLFSGVEIFGGHQ